MKSLILKDFLTLKSVSKQYIFIVGIFMVLGIIQKNVSFFSTYIVIMLTTVCISSFSYDEYAKWNEYAMAMPISRANIIKSKYLMGLIGALTAVVLSLLMMLLIFAVNGFDNNQFLFNICFMAASMAIALISLSVVIPNIIRKGVEKSRSILFLIYAVIAIVAFAVMGIFSVASVMVNAIIPDNQIYLYLILAGVLVLCFVLYYISYKASCRLFNKKGVSCDM